MKEVASLFVRKTPSMANLLDVKGPDGVRARQMAPNAFNSAVIKCQNVKKRASDIIPILYCHYISVLLRPCVAVRLTVVRSGSFSCFDTSLRTVDGASRRLSRSLPSSGSREGTTWSHEDVILAESSITTTRAAPLSYQLEPILTKLCAIKK